METQTETQTVGDCLAKQKLGLSPSSRDWFLLCTRFWRLFGARFILMTMTHCVCLNGYGLRPVTPSHPDSSTIEGCASNELSKKCGALLSVRAMAMNSGETNTFHTDPRKGLSWPKPRPSSAPIPWGWSLGLRQGLYPVARLLFKAPPPHSTGGGGGGPVRPTPTPGSGGQETPEGRRARRP